MKHQSTDILRRSDASQRKRAGCRERHDVELHQTSESARTLNIRLDRHAYNVRKGRQRRKLGLLRAWLYASVCTPSIWPLISARSATNPGVISTREGDMVVTQLQDFPVETVERRSVENARPHIDNAQELRAPHGTAPRGHL